MSKNGKYYRKSVKRSMDDKSQPSLMAFGVKKTNYLPPETSSQSDSQDVMTVVEP